MEAAGVPSLAIATFKAHYAALRSGDTGEIPESAIELMQVWSTSRCPDLELGMPACAVKEPDCQWFSPWHKLQGTNMGA